MEWYEQYCFIGILDDNPAINLEAGPYTWYAAYLSKSWSLLILHATFGYMHLVLARATQGDRSVDLYLLPVVLAFDFELFLFTLQVRLDPRISLTFNNTETMCVNLDTS